MRFVSPGVSQALLRWPARNCPALSPTDNITSRLTGPAGYGARIKRPSGHLRCHYVIVIVWQSMSGEDMEILGFTFSHYLDEKLRKVSFSLAH